MFVRIDNVPRDYAWGSTTAIAELLARDASGVPEAELWLGAHPGSPSRILDEEAAGGARHLAEWIEADPRTAVGNATGLPFLLKVLAAAEPLSLQAHPSPEQAQAGFDRENAAGIALDAPHRNYKDPFHKPEMIYALSDTFHALCGFRPRESAASDLARLIGVVRQAGRGPREIIALETLIQTLGSGSAQEAYARIIAWTLGGAGKPGGALTAGGVAASEAGGAAVQGDADGLTAGGAGGVAAAGAADGTDSASVAELVRAAVTASRLILAEAGADDFEQADALDPVLRPFATVVSLNEAYPADPGVVLSLLLNRVTLRRGEALYLPAGNIHAYLFGVGIEIMASSDNVLRGGLTPKHVDVPELLSVLDTRPLPVPLIDSTRLGAGVEAFRPAIADFQLVHRAPGGSEVPVPLPGPAIALATSGQALLHTDTGRHTLARGQAVYLTPDETSLTISGPGEVFVATTGFA